MGNVLNKCPQNGVNLSQVKVNSQGCKSISFQAGAAGTWNNVSDRCAAIPCYGYGGAGAGGIVITSTTATIQNPVGSEGQSANGGAGGYGGVGFGAGGGGGGIWFGGMNLNGGNGTQGFVYIVELDLLFTSSSTYKIPTSGKYQFILMGGGGSGSGGTSVGNGGSCGDILRFTKNNIAANTTITITIGLGGIGSVTGNNGGDTIIVIGTSDKVKAFGGKARTTSLSVKTNPITKMSVDFSSTPPLTMTFDTYGADLFTYPALGTFGGISSGNYYSGTANTISSSILDVMNL